ncbi:MAG: hypothetical protein J0L92_22635, partial [Deltaproteobacteria bacterium]|nr:hypothetical protein [Deltaproteobacteria bacterium]
MIAPDRLAKLDAELDALGVSADRVANVLTSSRGAGMSLDDVDAALGSLSSRFETRVPDGSLARSGSWERAPSDPGAAPVIESAREAGSGVLDVDPLSLAHAELPAVLSERPPSTDGIPIAVESLDAQAEPATGQSPIDDGDRPSIEISIEPSEPGLSEAPDAGADDGPSEDRPSIESGLAESALFDADEGTDTHQTAELAAAEASLRAAAGMSALELEIEGDVVATPPREQSSAKFAVPRDSVHPSPKSVIPPPTSADLDADLASILADELEPASSPAAPVGDELESEATALFSADMFGASAEPSLAELISRPPPADVDGDPADAVEIDIDDDVLVYDAGPAAPPPPPPSGTR